MGTFPNRESPTVLAGDNDRLSQPTTEPAVTVRTSDNQLFCCKSIDKLISDSEHPEHRLSKSLALGR